MQVIEKVADILELMAANPNKKQWRGTEISNDLNLNISTAHRLLQSLKKTGFIHQDMDTKHYSLGMNLIYYAEIVREMNIPGMIIYPSVQKLFDLTGETCFVTMKQGDTCVVIESITSHHELRIVKPIGDTKILCESPCGKVILAFLPRETQVKMLECYAQDKAKCEKDLAFVRENKYIEEYVRPFDSTVLSTPVFSEQGMIVASLSVIIPNCRLDEERKLKIIDNIKQISSEFVQKK
ncbi:MAG: helix-turn-helix domain-containing protein [Eubacteriaceae bacterium]|nr:helix-turn-helix domain-containing protein [Eubacteriaceae bacterium]